MASKNSPPPGPQSSGGSSKKESRQLTLVKKGHYYVFRYQPGEEGALLQTLIDLAENPSSPLDWFDAAVLSHQMGHRMADEMQALLKSKMGAPGNYKKADAT
jgi:hypothetical protein